MPYTTNLNQFITADRVGKRIRLRGNEVDTQCRIILPGSGGPYGEFLPGDFIDFHVETVANACRFGFFGDSDLTVSQVYVNGVLNNTGQGNLMYSKGQTARAYYTDVNRWEVEVSSVLTMDKPIIKPAPLQTTYFVDAATYEFGQSRFHNYHIRVTAPADATILVKADSFWATSGGTQQLEYWANNFAPISAGPMPQGGTVIIGKHGAGNVIFAADPGVTINTPDTLIISNLHGKATLIKVGIDEWDLEGNIGA